MLTEQEKEILNFGKQNGKSDQEIMTALSRFRSGDKPNAVEQKKPLSNRIAEGLGLGKAVDVFGTEIARAFAPDETRGQIEPNKQGALAGATAQTLAIPASAAITGGGSLLGQTAAGLATGYLYDVGSDLAEGKSAGEVVTPGLGTVVGGVAPGVLKLAGMGIKGAGNLVTSGVKNVAENIPTPSLPPGLKQVGTEMAERVPRAIEKGKTALDEAATRAERIKVAPPRVQNAIKVGLDDVMIGAVEQADEPTKQAYKKMVEIAEQPRTGLRPAVRPESVAGDAVADQYKILDTQRKNVGSQIGDAVDKLSTKGVVDVLPAQRNMRQLLFTNGIKPDISGKLVFDGSSLTPKQQGLVQQLYEIATQSEQMTPRQIYNIDKLFSQLQREARFDGLDNLYLTTKEGDINAYRAFRNIFSNELDRVAPEIAPLNKQYAQLRNLQDDIEGSIVKRGNFESTRNVDPAEFAQTNLRRLFSDASSAADYRALADKLDAFARSNGYNGANPQDLAGFAQRLRELYPETVPETSFQGGISGGIKNIIGNVLDFGKPTELDKQKALKELLGIQVSRVDGMNALAAVPGTASEDNTTQSASAAVAGAGVIDSVRKGALDQYISGLEDQLDKLAESNPNNFKNLPRYKQIMKMLSKAAKELRKVI